MHDKTEERELWKVRTLFSLSQLEEISDLFIYKYFLKIKYFKKFT